MSSVLDDLTPREIQILEELSKYGHSNKVIGDNLGIDGEGVKHQLTNVMIKLEAINRTHAVIIYLQLKAKRQWVVDHGPDELYNKFRVWSNRKQRWIDEDEFIFVLRPETDKHAVVALKTYAQSSNNDYPMRAMQIREKLLEIEERNGA